MESFVKLFYEWEIELLVLLSFTLQMFLFITGSSRRRSASMLLGFSLWISYVAADLVAVFARGYLARNEGATVRGETSAHHLAFFWAPCLLIHLGGQDTITAFSIEDNKLWLRHLLNLFVQVSTSLYVFWMSVGIGIYRDDQLLLVAGIFVFISGIIKYGERTWALKCGNLESLGESGTSYTSSLESLEGDFENHNYANFIWHVVKEMPSVWQMYSLRFHHLPSYVRSLRMERFNSYMKHINITLGMMYDDLYTKALVLRSRSGIILRCISHVSLCVAFVIFTISWSKQNRYNGADITITYVLFAGAFLVDISTVFMLMMSPWTWAWLVSRKYRRLARWSWYLLSCKVGWPEKRPQWSGSMGQYNFLNYAGCKQSRFSKLMKMGMRKMTGLVGASGEGTQVYWISKLLDTVHVKVDKVVMECMLKEAKSLSEESRPGPMSDLLLGRSSYRQWPKLWSCLQQLRYTFVADFGWGIVVLHLLTEVHLTKVASSTSSALTDPQLASLVAVCRKLSNYMLHLYVNHPQMLPLTRASDLGEYLKEIILDGGSSRNKEDTLDNANHELLSTYNCELPERSMEALMELRDLWARLLLYGARKSPPELHAAHLAKGGELFTFGWYLMAIVFPLDNSWMNLTNPSAVEGNFLRNPTYVFYVRPRVLPRMIDATIAEEAPEGFRDFWRLIRGY